ncbi:MAG: tape measure protein [Bacteroidota bacterium]
MNNTIEFVLRMKNLMSSELTKVSSASQSTFSKVAKSVDQVTGRNKILGMSFNELQTKIKQTEDTISKSTIPRQIAAARRELATLQRQSNNHTGNLNTQGNSGIGIGAIAGGTILGNVITQGASMISDGIGSMIKGSMKRETAIAGLSTFLGKSGAKDAYSNIQKDAEATPFDTASLLEVNRSLISAGLDARSARTDTMNLANAVVAVGGSNDTLTRMAANMQQIKTVGKATAMDIRQFGIAGINIYSMLAKSTGKSIDQVKEMEVTYEQLAKALQMASDKGGVYEGALGNAMNTQQGKWSNFTESFVNKLADIGTAFSPVTNGILDMGSKLSGVLVYVESFANWVTSGSTSAGVFITVLAGLTAGYVSYLAIMGGVALWTGIVTKAQLLWNLALTANPIGIVIVAIAALVGGIAVAYNKFETFRAIVDGVGASLKEIGRLILAVVTGDILSIPGIMKNIGSSFSNGYNRSINISAIERHKQIKERNTQREKDRASDKAKTSALSTGGAIMATNNASGKTAGETVAGAGPKVVNIHLGKFFDTIQFTTMDGKETAEELEKVVMECLARVLYNGAKTV